MFSLNFAIAELTDCAAGFTRAKRATRVYNRLLIKETIGRVYLHGLKKFGGRKEGSENKNTKFGSGLFVEKLFAPFFHERSSRPSQWKLERSVACEG